MNEVLHLGRLKLSVSSITSMHLRTNMIRLGQILGNKVFMILYIIVASIM